MKKILLLSLGLFLSLCAFAADLLVEAESFSQKGGWVVDQQFMDQMGSPYLMAHGLGCPVADASTSVVFPKKGVYYVYARTFNWTSPWHDSKGPGQFQVGVGKQMLPAVIGDRGNEWRWQPVGKIKVRKTETTLTLHDLTGFNGRCDALYFTTDSQQMPPDAPKQLAAFRKEKLRLTNVVPKAEQYDLVVVGGGIAGMCAAVSAARLGCRVALLNDRPIWGGNNSSEVRVHLGGRIAVGPYVELGNLLKEFGPSRMGNAQPAEIYEDQKKTDWLQGEEQVSLFPNYRAIAVNKNGNRIVSVLAQHIESGEEKVFKAPLFVDCTGDGTIGYLAGADFRMGREGRSDYGEPMAPEHGDKMTMGASVQWYSIATEGPSSFPIFNYGLSFDDKKVERVLMGEWTWETGMNFDQIKDFERIRDYGLMVVFSNWSYLKNQLKQNERFRNRKLEWVAFVAGKRESRRLLGDYVLTENDLTHHIVYDDASFATSWTIDLHYPQPQNLKNFPGEAFKSYAHHEPIYIYPVPYRCLYSRNVDNLFMAGRNISVTHIALGTVRVMRTTGMMGEVVGMAAALCRKYGVQPRQIYQSHLPELKSLMSQGVGHQGLPNNQRYNQGSTLGESKDKEK